jgi:thiol:disulfide interchange protein
MTISHKESCMKSLVSLCAVLCLLSAVPVQTAENHVDIVFVQKKARRSFGDKVLLLIAYPIAGVIVGGCTGAFISGGLGAVAGTAATGNGIFGLGTGAVTSIFGVGIGCQAGFYSGLIYWAYRMIKD